MTKFNLIALLGLLWIGTACNNTPKQEEASSQGMEQFAEDEAFKQAHEGPAETELDASGQMIEFDTPDGKKGSAYALFPEAETGKYLFVIHEWWGLNDNIKREAQNLYNNLPGVSVLALDIYDGNVATNADDAGKYMQAVQKERAESIVKGAIAYAGADARIATIGWCFGGGWSLQASIMAGPQGAGCVMYYGMPVQNARELAPLQADILGIFASRDGWITPAVASDFEKLAKATGKKLEVHQFDADHAFANPSNPNFDEEAAKKANELALNFLKTRL